ncbi:phage tail component protein [Trichuris suis]|nr:phage tail component protein [Trichuris suis]
MTYCHSLKGDYVWIPSNSPSSAGAIGARVLDVDKGRLYVRDDDGREVWLEPTVCLSIMHPTSVQGVENMLDLIDMHEAAVLRNLAVRFSEKMIYTYASTILISVNPYGQLPIYTADLLRLYRGRRIGELPPHIFAVAEETLMLFVVRSHLTVDYYSTLVRSGESGSGKTETAKLVLQYLAVASSRPTRRTWIEEQILEANPVLEAFGNAKTCRNDNSSRFGRYTDIRFDSEGGMESARIEPYLLERSRVVSHALHERNFHVFYCFLAGLSERELEMMELERDPMTYYYLCQGREPVAYGRDDASDFDELCTAMKVLYFSDIEIISIFSLLAAILHLGNIRYSATAINNHEATEIKNASAVLKVAKILQVDQIKLVNALTTRTITTKDESVVTSMTAEQSLDARDALAKGLYGRLFTCIVEKINLALRRNTDEAGKGGSIGILDIYGFEQEEYAREKIDWSPIDFADNYSVLDLIAHRTSNIFSLLDEECMLPNGTDLGFLAKAHQSFARNNRYVKPKSDLSCTFTVIHYTGPVTYHVKGFVEKNREPFSKDLLAVIRCSKLPILYSLFANELQSNDSGRRTLKVTAASQFRKSLEALMCQLDQRKPFFVRCIKPNDLKEPMLFNRNLCYEQLLCLGLMDTIHIRKSGYPVRFKFANFAARYKVLLSNLGMLLWKNDCWVAEQVCQRLFGPPGDYQLGRTRVFLKDAAALLLEQNRDKLLRMKATIVQKVIRGWIIRQKYLTARHAAVIIQKNWRRYIQQRRYKAMMLGFARLQALVRTKRLTCEYQELRNFITQFQAYCRGMLLRRHLRRCIASGNNRILPSVSQSQIAIQEHAELGADDTTDYKKIDEFFDFLLADVDPVKEMSSDEIVVEEELDMNLYQFSRFAAAYFVGNATGTYTRKVLRCPLLHHDDAIDRAASAAINIWIMILRFMGDSPSPQQHNGSGINGFRCPSGLAHICTMLFCNKLRNRPKVDRLLRVCPTVHNADPQENGLQGGKAFAMLPSRRSLDVPAKFELNYETIDHDDTLRKLTMTSMEKLHFIIGHGILRPQLRDEIFCQICKQLTNNGNSKSVMRGWVLLSLCLGCFAPSERLIKYLRCFIRRQAPRDFAVYCEQRLDRTMQNGPRSQPPSYYELQATKQRKPLILPVTFMNGMNKNLVGDSAITAQEMCHSLAKSIGLKDSFGFSVYIALSDKVSSLGSGAEHVLDAISQCEQYARQMGSKDQFLQWRLFFRKEIFTPWHNPADDPTATDLIYHQVTRGLKFGEYRCNRVSATYMYIYDYEKGAIFKEEDLALLIAYQYFVDYGYYFEVEQLRGVVHNYLPDYVLDGVDDIKASIECWVKSVLHAGLKSLPEGKRTNVRHVQETVVSLARLKWPLLFSKFFEAYKLAGQQSPKNEVVAAVNWTGVYVVDSEEQVLLELTFVEITNVSWSPPKSGMHDMAVVRVETIHGDEYSFHSPAAEEIASLVLNFLNGLRARSRFLIALVDNPSTSNGLPIRKGDLLKLDDKLTAESLIKDGTAKAENVATGEFGVICSNDVYVLPTLSKPPLEVLNQLVQYNERQRISRDVVPYEPAWSPHTLEEFANNHFRHPLMTITSNTIPRQRRREELWCHSYEPLTKPLLKKVEQIDEASRMAVLMYRAVMKYMDNMSIDGSRASVCDLTESIFAPAIKQAMIISAYPQGICIMKQLTNNPNPVSVEKGWELLWLCSGLFPPSQTLQNEVACFLRSRHHPVAADCFNRIQKAGSRKYPPHQVEVEAIQRKTTQVFHKVYFPNDMFESIEVESCSKTKDLVQRIGKLLGLKDVKGFALFIKVNEKMSSDDFFFDFIRCVNDMSRKSRTADEKRTFEYQIYMMRKLWVDVVAGKDRQADIVFHYPQEVPKYLRGYHKCSKEEAIELAALIYRASYGDSQSQLTSTSVVGELLPQNLLKTSALSEWKRQISMVYNRGCILSRDEAKIQFLKLTSKWPTFGSVFFDIKQTGITTLPEKLLFAINKNGIMLIQSDNREILCSYPYTEVSNWSSGSTYFHLMVGSAVNGTRLLCETTMGYKMDDLITSYISYFLADAN